MTIKKAIAAIAAYFLFVTQAHAYGGTVNAWFTGVATNPTSSLTLPSTQTAYAAGSLIASSATAGSVVVPSFTIANSAGGALIPRIRLSTNDATFYAVFQETSTNNFINNDTFKYWIEGFYY